MQHSIGDAVKTYGEGCLGEVCSAGCRSVLEKLREGRARLVFTGQKLKVYGGPNVAKFEVI